MNFFKKPAFGTEVFVLVLLGLVFLRSHGWRLPISVADFSFRSHAKVPTPEDTVYGMLDAARAGDTATYVNTFAGSLQLQIEQVVKESGRAQFARYLTGQSSSFQSVALTVTDQPSDREARLRVEYIYTNRNEVQTFQLQKTAGQWRIVSISGTDQIKTLIPYGTAVTDD